MKIIESAQGVAAGWYLALIVAVVWKETRKGELSFLRCRITSGKDSVKGREVDYLVPRYVKEGTHFHRFLVSVLGSVDVGKDVDPQVLVDRAVAIRVARVRKGKHEYCNIVAVSLPGEVEKQTRRKGRRRG